MTHPKLFLIEYINRQNEVVESWTIKTITRQETVRKAINYKNNKIDYPFIDYCRTVVTLIAKY